MPVMTTNESIWNFTAPSRPPSQLFNLGAVYLCVQLQTWDSGHSESRYVATFVKEEWGITSHCLLSSLAPRSRGTFGRLANTTFLWFDTDMYFFPRYAPLNLDAEGWWEVCAVKQWTATQKSLFVQLPLQECRRADLDCLKNHCQRQQQKWFYWSKML